MQKDHDFSLRQELLGHDPNASSTFLVPIPIQRGTDSWEWAWSKEEEAEESELAYLEVLELGEVGREVVAEIVWCIAGKSHNLSQQVTGEVVAIHRDVDQVFELAQVQAWQRACEAHGGEIQADHAAIQLAAVDPSPWAWIQNSSRHCSSWSCSCFFPVIKMPISIHQLPLEANESCSFVGQLLCASSHGQRLLSSKHHCNIH